MTVSSSLGFSAKPPAAVPQQLIYAALLVSVALTATRSQAQDPELSANQSTVLEAAASPERFASAIAPLALATANNPGVAKVAPPSDILSNALPEAPQPSASESSSLESFSASPEREPFSLGPDPQTKPLDARTAPKTQDAKPIAPLYTKYIPAGWGYQPIHGREKLILGARDLYSPGNILAIVASSGYSHLANSQPNYGVNSKAFGQRLGAIAIRETAQGIFTDGVFSVVFHQDPRYFAEGPRYNPIHRTLYAITRPLIVRTTNGTGSTVNSSLLAGYAAAALLNNAYYPQINRNVKDTFTSYGSSIGGAALGFFVSEFTDDALEFLHLKHRP